MRVGHGYDIHRLVAGRELVLAGVSIPCEVGLLGHSDADVVIHAVIDSLLGAAGLADIGQMFPDTDPRYAGVRSGVLLEQVMKAVCEKGFTVCNVDVTVIAEKPRLSGVRQAMRGSLAGLLGVAVEQVNIKARTNESLGEIGQGLAMACHAVALITKDEK